MALSIEGAGDRDESRSVEYAEQLIGSLTGVLSARVVGSSLDSIEEIHVLTTREVSAKQTVRNVESALLAQLDLEVDHRKISVARTHREARSPDGPDGTEPEEVQARVLESGPGSDGPPRLLFVGHEVESEGAHRVQARVIIEWDGDRIAGEARGTDLPRARLEMLANALLAAVEELLDTAGGDDVSQRVALALDGVKVLTAFDRRYVLVGVHALHGREVVVLSGSAPADDELEKSVIMASLQATDRWVRGRL